jgi:hypothetical protein
MKRIWRRNSLAFGAGRPGIAVQAIQKMSASRNNKKKLDQFDLWNEIYDEYVSWILSLLIVCYSELKRYRTGRSLPREFFRATSVLLFRVFSDLMAIRNLCRSGFDVAAKTLSRSTIEHIDTLVLIINEPTLAREFNKLNSNKASNLFWHRYIARGKVWKVVSPIWKRRFGDEFDAETLINWMYDYHGILGMSVHPSFSGGAFSALALGSGSEDSWLGIFGDRADISADTYYYLVVHIWKLTILVEGFPFSNPGKKGLVVRYSHRKEFHRHVRGGGSVLFDLLLTIWDPKVAKIFFKKLDTSHIWPSKPAKKISRRRAGHKTNARP